MPHSTKLLAAATLLVATHVVTALSGSALADELRPPEPPREFRAAWIATVANIDWPSRPGLSNDAMRSELAEQFDLAIELNLNAIVLQVRPACDAIYASELEPWTEFLTGKQGQPPADGFDPLAWACEEAHRRGLELHAWFNPYRATHPSAKGPLDSTHIAVRRPELAPQYGKHRWLDPGEADAAEHSIDVVLDVVRRYDVDAVHFDDYFYPYPVTEDAPDATNGLGADAGRPAKVEVPFPDDASWQRYCDATPESERLSRNDWRRDNVNRFVQDLGEAIHRTKPYVRFGISPFGIWRPGTPPSIQGFDQYDKLYADARLWLREGWVDYFSPQLYWAIEQKPQSFVTLLDWWTTQNPRGRNLWPGLFTSKTAGDPPKYEAAEIAAQIEYARQKPGAGGHIHFSMKALQNDWNGVATRLKESVYAEPALVPATPWLAGDEPPPAAPTVEPTGASTGDTASFRLASPDGQATRWLLQKRVGGQWKTAVRGATLEEVRVRRTADGARPTMLAVSAIDALGRKSEPTIVPLAID